MTNVSYIKTRNAQGATAFEGIEVVGGYQYKEALKSMGYCFNGFNGTWCKTVGVEDAVAELVDAVITCKLSAEDAQRALDKAVNMEYLPETVPVKEETIEKLQAYAMV